jgi:hypothetical protein
MFNEFGSPEILENISESREKCGIKGKTKPDESKSRPASTSRPVWYRREE